MNLRHLRSFVAIVDAGSFCRAATLIHVAQPALTAQVKHLEDEFKVKLLIRSSGGTKPSAAGSELYREAVRLLAIADALPARIGNHDGELDGTVTVAYPAGLNPALFGRALIRLKTLHPRVRVDVVTTNSEEIQKSVHDGSVDFGVTWDPQTLDGLTFQTLATEACLLCGRDPEHLLRRRLMPADRLGSLPTIRFTDLLSLPLVLPSRRSGLRRALDEACSNLGGTLRIVHEQDSSVMTQALSSLGEGFHFGSTSTLSAHRPDPDHPEIRARVTDPGIDQTMSLVSAIGRALSPATRSVMQVLRNEFASPRQAPLPAPPIGPSVLHSSPHPGRTTMTGRLLVELISQPTEKAASEN